MKKLLFLILVIIPLMAIADTKTITWYNGDSVYDTTTCTIGNDLILPATPTKYGHTFQGWKTAYTPIAYIESTGTQYFCTNIHPSLTMVSQIGIMITAYNGIGVYGFYNSPNVQYRVFCNADGGFYFDIGKNNTYSRLISPNNFQTNVRYDYEIGNMYVKDLNTNTELQRLDSVTSFGWNPQNYNLCVFSNRTPYQSGRIYYLKIYDNDILVLDLIPVVDKNGVACMFDRVSGTYFYNAGTGSFIAGPAI